VRFVSVVSAGVVVLLRVTVLVMASNATQNQKTPHVKIRSEAMTLWVVHWY